MAFVEPEATVSHGTFARHTVRSFARLRWFLSSCYLDYRTPGGSFGVQFVLACTGGGVGGGAMCFTASTIGYERCMSQTWAVVARRQAASLPSVIR